MMDLRFHISMLLTPWGLKPDPVPEEKVVGDRNEREAEALAVVLSAGIGRSSMVPLSFTCATSVEDDPSF